MSKNRFDWPALMRAGLHGLGLAPDAFWRLTPVELMVMLGGGGQGAGPLNRARLDELARAYPDTPRTGPKPGPVTGPKTGATGE